MEVKMGPISSSLTVWGDLRVSSLVTWCGMGVPAELLGVGICVEDTVIGVSAVSDCIFEDFKTDCGSLIAWLDMRVFP